MGPVTYQTIRLSKGKHTSKEHGACVMELASMLADEPFSDHPAAVCPVIGSLLRAYNDSIDDRRRQDLYGYAARIVGSRGTTEVERMRTEHLTAWLATPPTRRWTRFMFPARLRAMSPKPPLDVLGAGAVRSLNVHDDRTHENMLELIDDLLAMGADERAPSAGGPAGTLGPSETERTHAV
jgi:hypothetical protein